MSSDKINPVIGDESFVAAFGCQPVDAPWASDKLRVSTHLSYALKLLSKRSPNRLDADRQEKRRHALQVLEQYISAGEFPVQSSNLNAARKPAFIDKTGVPCAVAKMIEASCSSGTATAAFIDKHHHDALVQDMAKVEPALGQWAENNGFSIEELAIIQPTYEFLKREQAEEKMREALKTGEHVGVNCDGCESKDIKGVVYHCLFCADVNFCKICVEITKRHCRTGGTHNANHVLARFETPMQRIYLRSVILAGPLVPPIVPASWPAL